MRRLILLIFALNIGLLALSQYEIMIYKQWFPKMIWANQTLELDFQAQRQLLLSCKMGVQM